MKLTPELKELALRVAQSFEVNTFALMDEGEVHAFAERFLAALPNSEPVAWQSKKNLDFVTTYPSKVKQWESSGYEVRPLYAAPPVTQDYKAQLAESQAREAKLQESMAWVSLIFTDDTLAHEREPELWLPSLEQAIATPSDATALNELIAKAGEVMQERAAVECEKNYNFSKPLASAIRALSEVTLEDLKS